MVLAGGGAAASEVSPVLWPAEQRAFWLDGPGLLVPVGERERVLTMGSDARGRWIAEFLADPVPESETNELRAAIERRRGLAIAALGPQFTLLDARARLLFLHGAPSQREIVDCEHVYRGLEIWSYPLPGDAAAGQSGDRDGLRRLLVYQPQAGQPYRLWRPSDGKRPLYTEEMEYWLDQYHELQAFISGRRFDLQLCDEARDVDRVSGIGGLVLYRDDRPRDQDVLRWLAPPDDLTAWSRSALASTTESAGQSLVLEPRLVAIDFPERSGQRLLVRVTLALPRDERLQPFDETDAEPEYRIQVAGLSERYGQDIGGGAGGGLFEAAGPDERPGSVQGEIFDEWLVRFQLPVGQLDSEAAASAALARVEAAAGEATAGGGEPGTGSERSEIGLVLERAYRPEEVFHLRLGVRDEVSGATGLLALGIEVPSQPVREAETNLAGLVLASGDQATGLAIPGADGIVLVPPETDVVLGLWRAEALVSGEAIEAVRFLVDGQQQFQRRGEPYSTELRLAKYPREQVVRVEGLDADGEMVASDELVINQQRGELRVRIAEPPRGAPLAERVSARADVVVPEERRVSKVEFSVNDELQATVTQAPWEAVLEVPPRRSQNDLVFLTAVAELDDGSRAEDVRFLGVPEGVERLEVDFVELYTSVTDRSNRPVAELGQEAFEIFEDGRRQEIAKFELVEDLPITVGITIDTSGSMTRSLGEARRAAVEFLERVVTPRDRSFAVGFADRPRLIMPRTSDVVAVSRALAGVRANGNTALYDAVVTSLYYFRGVRGRRALILLSDGEDTASSIDYKDAREYAQRSGVAIYSIGLDIGRLQIDVRNKLGELAQDTGGRSFFISSADELRSVYGEIERELRSQYLLAYASDRPGEGGDFRTVEVKMVGPGRGLRARTISGYYP
ncbi:MAG: VWA domain-containing protein [Acidobacteria bacterium]|nr:MAG: VWA domain-containing protein [Acidobacteriota bacterium]REK05618.1 MAG: VWA domain-containing protein [Acidobacteriota bacterium]